MPDRGQQVRQREPFTCRIVGEDVSFVIQQKSSGSVWLVEPRVELREVRAHPIGRLRWALVVRGLVAELADREAPRSEVTDTLDATVGA